MGGGEGLVPSNLGREQRTPGLRGGGVFAELLCEADRACEGIGRFGETILLEVRFSDVSEIACRVGRVPDFLVNLERFLVAG